MEGEEYAPRERKRREVKKKARQVPQFMCYL
jgi:hypothetical protein